jgi:hypothetical protein
MGTDRANSMKELTAMNKEYPVVTVGRNGLSFNVRTADVLHRAAFVRVLLNAETCQLAVQAASALSPQFTAFFRPEVFKSNRIKINSRSMARQIRETAGWTEHGTWNIAGVYSAKGEAHDGHPKAIFEVLHSEGADAVYRLLHRT